MSPVLVISPAALQPPVAGVAEVTVDRPVRELGDVQNRCKRADEQARQRNSSERIASSLNPRLARRGGATSLTMIDS